MSGNLIVGFSAAANSNGSVPGLLSSPAPAPGAETGFAGLLGALLGAGGALFGTATTVPVTETAIPELAVAATAAPVPPTISPPTAEDIEAIPTEERPADPATLLLDLAEALTALDAALASGQPVDPLLREQLDEALAALAAYLEIPTGTTRELTAAALAGAMPEAAAAPGSEPELAPRLAWSSATSRPASTAR